MGLLWGLQTDWCEVLHSHLAHQPHIWFEDYSGSCYIEVGQSQIARLRLNLSCSDLTYLDLWVAMITMISYGYFRSVSSSQCYLHYPVDVVIDSMYL